jgi:tRNA pseudouridine38-40 synthase
MLEASKHLLGKHDFTSFRAAECQAKSAVKTLDTLESVRTGDHINITAGARSFLRRQVRNIVGTLVMVGEGKIMPGQVANILAARDRESAGPCAPPDGLYLVSVEYD